MVQLISVDREPSFPSTFQRAIGADRVSSFSSRRNAKEHVRAIDTATEIAKAFSKVARDVHGRELPLPPPPQAIAGLGVGGGTAQADALRAGLETYCAVLHKSLQECPCFGRLELLSDDECVFHYSESDKHHGLLQTQFDSEVHRHWLTGIRQRNLDSLEIELPSDQQQIVNCFPKDARRYLTVITGMLVQMQTADGGTVRRDHVVGRTAKAVGRSIRKYGPSAAAGVGAGAASVGAVAGTVWAIGSMMAAAAAPIAVAAVDPAICWGEIVITGYVE